jgi:hypothetical protein
MSLKGKRALDVENGQIVLPDYYAQTAPEISVR